ncbi:MAG: NAD(P)/FAD-dependent oxidoreductase, partial [Actinobacteria bacterium]|nr:NAD(P)/FAD-dependent oxidoreductase [Actinomycetota bacterium]
MIKPKVVIIGAGFGGLTAARSLRNIANVTLVDRHNFQTFLPLLYQVASAGLAADHVVHPVRGALRKTDIQFRMGSPLVIDYTNKTVKLDSSELLSYDYLILALGSVTNDFGIKGVSEFSLGMKSVNEALKIRADIMRRFEDLCRFTDDTELSISVVGGGPTGIEMAGAIAELKRGPLKSDSAKAAKNIHIRIVEAGPRLLPSFSAKLSERTKRDLEKLGVEVILNAGVKEVKADTLTYDNGLEVPSQITIWAAGVKGEPTLDFLQIPMRDNRVIVDSTLQVEHRPDIFAIGDSAGAKSADGRYLPMVAPVAMQQARFLAKHIQRKLRAEPLVAFKYKDKGSMATIGRHKAVVEVGNFRIGGAIAWYIWLWLHLFYLVGGRNKLGTMAEWTWNYLTFDRGNRHI